jgi:hypothetical protein
MTEQYLRAIDPNTPYLVDGKPVVGGYAYFGVANQDPKLNPITIFSDPDHTIVISNPQRTDANGLLENRVYMQDEEYSFILDDVNNNQIRFEAVLNPLGYTPPVTADLDLNGFEIINAAPATSNDGLTTLGQNNKAYPISAVTDITSTPDQISVTLPIPLDSIDDNQQIIVQLRHGANTGTVTPEFRIQPFAYQQMYRDNNEELNADDTVGLDHFIHLSFNATLNKWELTNAPVQGVIENDIDMDGYKHTNVADADDNNQYAAFGQANKLYPFVVPTNGSSTNDAISVDLPLQPDVLEDGQQVIVLMLHGNNNTPTPTFKFGTEPTKFIYVRNGEDPSLNDTQSTNAFCHFIYNASLDEWNLHNPKILVNSNFQDDSINGEKIVPESIIGSEKIDGNSISGDRADANFLKDVIAALPDPTAGTDYLWETIGATTLDDSAASRHAPAFVALKDGTITFKARAETPAGGGGGTATISFLLYRVAPRSCPGNVQITEPGSGDATWNMADGATYNLDIDKGQTYWFVALRSGGSGDAADEGGLEIMSGNDCVLSPVSLGSG